MDVKQTALDPSPLFALNALRTKYDDAVIAVTNAQKTVDDANKLVKDAADDVVVQKGKELAEIQACEQSEFDKYTETQNAAKATRTTLLEDI